MSRLNLFNRGHQAYCTCVDCRGKRHLKKQTRLKHELEQPTRLEQTRRVRGQALADGLKRQEAGVPTEQIVKSTGPKITLMERIKRLFRE